MPPGQPQGCMSVPCRRSPATTTTLLTTLATRWRQRCCAARAIGRWQVRAWTGQDGCIAWSAKATCATCAMPRLGCPAANLWSSCVARPEEAMPGPFGTARMSSVDALAGICEYRLLTRPREIAGVNSQLRSAMVLPLLLSALSSYECILRTHKIECGRKY